MTQHILGTKIDVKMAGTMDFSGHILALHALLSAGFRLGDAGKRDEALNMFALARGLSSEVDKLNKEHPKFFENLINGFIKDYGGSGVDSTATPVARS